MRQMKKMQAMGISFFALLMLLYPAHAETSNAIKWLQKEPLTLFDFGLYKIEQKVNSLNFASDKMVGTVSYLADENKIIIRAQYSPQSGEDNFDFNKENCGKMWSRIHRQFGGFKAGTDVSDELVFYKGVYKPLIGVYFKHRGNPKVQYPVGMRRALIDMIEIRVERVFPTFSGCSGLLTDVAPQYNISK